MTESQMKIGINSIPGCAAVILVSEEDMCLVEAGKRFEVLFSLKDASAGQSILYGVSDSERRELCHRIYPKVKMHEEFTYSRRALLHEGRTGWIYVQASFLEEVNGIPSYLMLAEDATEYLLEKTQYEEMILCLKNANRELNAIFNTIIGGIAKVIKREGFPVLFANESFYHMIGYTEAEFKQECGSLLSNLAVSGDEWNAGAPDAWRWQYRRRDGQHYMGRIGVLKTDQSYEGDPVIYVVFAGTDPVMGMKKEPDRRISCLAFQNPGAQYQGCISQAILQEVFRNIPAEYYEYFICGLTENRIDEAGGKLFDLGGCDFYSITMDNVIREISNRWISEEDRKRWGEFNNRNWLLYLHDIGRRYKKRTYRIDRKDQEGNDLLVDETSILFTNPYTQEISACFVFLHRSLANGSRSIAGKAVNVPIPDLVYQEEFASEIRLDEMDERQPPEVYIRTFGYFDVFVNGKILDFPSKKGKELLAILVDRRGGICTGEEIMSVLWENEPMDRTTSGRYRQTALRLKKILEDAGIGDLLISKRGGRCVDPSKFTCDFYQFMSGEKKYRDIFHNLYMTNYSWGENTLAFLIEMDKEMKKI